MKFGDLLDTEDASGEAQQQPSSSRSSYKYSAHNLLDRRISTPAFRPGGAPPLHLPIVKKVPGLRGAAPNRQISNFCTAEGLEGSQAATTAPGTGGRRTAATRVRAYNAAAAAQDAQAA